MDGADRDLIEWSGLISEVNRVYRLSRCGVRHYWIIVEADTREIYEAEAAMFRQYDIPFDFLVIPSDEIQEGIIPVAAELIYDKGAQRAGLEGV